MAVTQTGSARVAINKVVNPRIFLPAVVARQTILALIWSNACARFSLALTAPIKITTALPDRLTRD